MAVRTKWYALDVVGEAAAEISVFDEIGGFGVSVAQFKEQFDLVKDRAEVRLLLNSPGGDITEGMALYNLLASIRAKLSVEVIGMAASMASVVALAGRELLMDEGTYLMIHNPWVITWGDADQLRHDAEVLDKMKAELVNIYQAHSDLEAEEIIRLMDEETWFTAEEARDAGFAASVKWDARAAALWHDFSHIGFRHAPAALCGAGRSRGGINTIRDFEAFLRDAGWSRSEAHAIASRGYAPAQRDAEGVEAVALAIRQMNQDWVKGA